MKTTIKEITPQWAAQILETRNPNNRNISERTVEKYARDMANGDWCLTHQGIAFDTNGDLLDGQHRLAAVVKARRPVQMQVTVGIPKEFQNNSHKTDTFACIDASKPRTAATNLEILRYKNTQLTASTARAVAMLCAGDGKVLVTAALVERIVKMMSPTIEKLATLACGTHIIRLRAPALGVIAFYHTSKPKEAEAFLVEAQTVSGAKGSPSRALATWMSRHAASGGKGQMDTLYVTASALYHSARGASVEKLYGSEDSIRWLRETNRSLKQSINSLLK